MSVQRYRGNRNGINLGSYAMKKGELIPTKVIEEIPSGRFGSLVRTGILVPVTSSDELDNLPEGETGDRCEICGEGPFKRLEQHVSLKHPPTDDDDDDEPEPDAPMGAGGAGKATGTLDVE